jgi:hypothetical protein
VHLAPHRAEFVGGGAVDPPPALIRDVAYVLEARVHLLE